MPLVKEMPSFNSYTYRFRNMIDHIDAGRIITQPASTTCSGLDTQLAIDLNGDIMPCHRLIYLMITTMSKPLKRINLILRIGMSVEFMKEY